MKNHISIRYNDQIAERIEQLKKWLNSTQTGIVETAINQLYETERAKRMDIQALTEQVARAIARMEADGIEGWGLENPDKELFDLVNIGSSTGCTSDTCNHVSHDPASPHYKIVPKSGKLVTLGNEMDGSETDYIWYALVSDDAPRFFEMRDPRHYWATIKEVEADKIPDWALAQLGQNAS